jgi:aminopeptidase
MNEKLKEYASLLIRVGLNIQTGQRLVISCPVECAWFARMCAQEAYDVGCKEVVMNWNDDALARMKYLHADDEIFDQVPLWRRHFFNDYALEGTAYLAISASDPENFKGVDHGRVVRAQQASGKALKDFDRLQMCSGFPWCIASIPIPSWADTVFPESSEKEAVERLWDAIFAAVRINGDGTAVE